MKRLFTLLLSVVALHAAQAQEIVLPSEPVALPAIDARALGMGGVAMASASGAHTLYDNAAMTAFATYPAKFSTSYYGQTDFDYYALSGYLRLGRGHVVQAGWRQYLREKGNRDSAIDLGYSLRLGEQWSVGVVGRYLDLKRYDERASALAFDLSAAWQRGVESLGEYALLRVGAKVENLGGFFEDAPYTLPVSLKAGAALETYFSELHQLTVGVDAGYCFNPSAVRGFQAAVGAEYTLMQLIRLRAGYHLGEKGGYNPSYGSVGAGVTLLHLRVDFAYLLAEKNSWLRNTYSISFGLDF